VDDNYQTDASYVLKRRRALNMQKKSELIYTTTHKLNHIQPSTRYRRGDITMIMDKRKHIHWRRLELTTDFVIWRERYARIFKDHNKQHKNIIREILLKFKH
jgi:hypothetical protein